MTLPRDYTLAEIDAMREIVEKQSEITLSQAEIEGRLRTYMSAGVTLADLRGGVVREPDQFEDETKC